MENKNEVKAKDTEPGASRHGNFINYYQFHSANERVQQLPRGIWHSLNGDKKYVVLDVGCNSGDLTFLLYNFLLSEQKQNQKVYMMGIDLDPILIQRSNEQNRHPQNITFQCLDFFSQNRDEILKHYLNSHKRMRFDVVFAFSITMWIHLNHGDSGLEQFLKAICQISDMVVIEPQLWKCYRNASRRLRRAKQDDFPYLKTLNLKGNIEEHIERILYNDCGFRKVSISEVNDWQRKLLIYKRN